MATAKQWEDNYPYTRNVTEPRFIPYENRKEMLPRKTNRINRPQLGHFIFPENLRSMVYQLQIRMILMFPGQRVIHWDGNKYRQNKKLLSMGIKMCEHCGYVQPIEKQICICGEEPFVIMEAEDDNI